MHVYTHTVCTKLTYIHMYIHTRTHVQQVQCQPWLRTLHCTWSAVITDHSCRYVLCSKEQYSVLPYAKSHMHTNSVPQHLAKSSSFFHPLPPLAAASPAWLYLLHSLSRHSSSCSHSHSHCKNSTLAVVRTTYVATYVTPVIRVVVHQLPLGFDHRNC